MDERDCDWSDAYATVRTIMGGAWAEPCCRSDAEVLRERFPDRRPGLIVVRTDEGYFPDDLAGWIYWRDTHGVWYSAYSTDVQYATGTLGHRPLGILP